VEKPAQHEQAEEEQDCCCKPGEKPFHQLVSETADEKIAFEQRTKKQISKRDALGGFFSKNKKGKQGLACIVAKMAIETDSENDDAAVLEDEEEGREQTTCTPTASEHDNENEAEIDSHQEGIQDELECAAVDQNPVCDLRALLAWRYCCNDSPLPRAIAQLCARPHSKAWREQRPTGIETSDRREPGEGEEKTSNSPACEDRALFGTKALVGRPRVDRGDRHDGRISRVEAASILTPSATAYRRLSAEDQVDRATALKRSVQSMLNKICPENIAAIARRIKSEAKISSVEELQIVIVLIFKKSLAEPHYCESYADLVYSLKNEMPEFPSPDGGKPVTFKSSLLTVCQNEFEAMPRSFGQAQASGADAEELAFQLIQEKKRFLANMKFIGNLFLRELIGNKIISSIVKDLMLCDSDEAPEEPIIECVCELFCSIGYTLESMPVGKIAVAQVCGRMLDLKGRKLKNGKGLYSKRVQFVIQDLLDTRSAGWAMKSFKASAKTKEEVRNEHANAKDTSADYVVAGQRPTYLSDQKNSEVGAKDTARGADWQEISKSRKR
jgi:hypothetical protein